MNRRVSDLFALVCLLVGTAVLFSCGGGGASTPLGGGNDTPVTGLSITTASLPDGYTGLAYDQTMISSGGKAPITWSYSGFLPAGLTLSSNGHITGTVTNAVFGDVDFIATDSSTPAQVVHKTLRMTIKWGLEIPPTVLSPGHINAPYDAIIQSSQQVDASSWRISKGSLPPGLALKNPTTTQVEIAGTPVSLGTYSFTVQVQSSNPTQVATRDYTLVIDSSLAIAPSALPDGMAGSPYSVALSVLNGVPPYTWSSTSLPAGLSLNPGSGLLSGTPSGPGNYWVDISVADSASPRRTGSAQFGLGLYDKLQFSGSVAGRAIINKWYYSSFTATGGKGPLSWSVLSGTIPPGMALGAQDGTLSGTPTQLGSYDLTIQVKDALQQTAQASGTLTVAPPSLAIGDSLRSSLPANASFSGNLYVTGGTPPYTWSIQSGSLPPGLSLNASSGTISGTPDAIGNYQFAIQVTDSSTPAQSVFRPYTIQVTAGKGRNDSIPRATSISNSSTYASISPYVDPSDSAVPAPDTDYYRIIAKAGDTVIVATKALSQALDSVLELVDENGHRLSTCREQDGSAFTAGCMNDDISGETADSRLELSVPGAAGTQTTFYAHVLDARGDARPDMRYYIELAGAVMPLRIEPASNQFLCVIGSVFSNDMKFFASGGTAPLTWALDSGSLPPGLSIASDGTLSGNPTTAGTYKFVLRATDSATPAQTATQSFTVMVETAPTITTTSLPDGRTGVIYIYSLEATGGTPPYSWTSGSVCSPDCPGLTMQEFGALSGAPRNPGTYTIKAQMQDRMGIRAEKELTLTILPGPLVTPAISMDPFKVGVKSWDSITAYGGTPPYTFALAAGTLPPGLTLQNLSGSGYISGVPTVAGTYTLTVQVSDSRQPAQTSLSNVTVVVSP
jgi:hypothetical protein